MSIVAIYFVLVAVAVAAAVGGIALGRRAHTTIWPLAVLACFVLATAWQEVALRTFASQERDGMKGLILRPVPYGGGDHEFSPRGAHYAKFSSVVPGLSALVVAVIIAMVGVAISDRTSEVAASVALAVLGGALGFALVAIARLLAASEIFI